MDVRFLKKAEREAVKEEFKKKYKESKRAKLEPQAAGVAAEVGEQRNTGSGDKGSPALAEKGTDHTNEDLRLKLQKRLEDMRKQRKADEKNEKVKSAKDWKENAMGVGRKKAASQQRQAQRQKMSKAAKGDGSQRYDRGTEQQSKKKAQESSEKDLQQANKKSNDFSFSKLEFGGDNAGHPGKKKQKVSKQELLDQVQQDQAKVLTKDEERKKAWKAALARAHGEKVLDDARLLKRSIKKEGKIREKKSKAWADRLEKVNEKKIQKQQKRKDNLQSRIDAKKDKKKERREKKLMNSGGNRAGFEGRKKGFIGK